MDSVKSKRNETLDSKTGLPPDSDLRGLGVRQIILKYHSHPSNKQYNLTRYNNGIVALSVATFLSTAVQFCHDELRRGMELVSVGSGDGYVENEIMAAYRDRFKSEFKITLIDPEPSYAGKVDYKIVDELIQKRPGVVGNCSLFIIWPEIEYFGDGHYDLGAIRKLRPHAVLTVYETTGGSGSDNFCRFLDTDGLMEGSMPSKSDDDSELADDYSIEEVARANVWISSIEMRLIKMVILRRK